MRSIRPVALLALTAAVIASSSCATMGQERPEVIAYQVPLEAASQVASVAATSAYNVPTNPNIRGVDGKLVPSLMSTFPQIGEISISDGTGVTLTTPTAAVIKDSSGHLTVANAVRGSVVVDGDNGTITIKQAGLYEICFFAADGVGANTDTQTISVFENINGGGAGALAPVISSVAITLTAEPWVPLSSCGFRNYTAAQAKGTSNVVLDARATSSTGNMTLKKFRFSAKKVDENDPPSP